MTSPPANVGFPPHVRRFRSSASLVSCLLNSYFPGHRSHSVIKMRLGMLWLVILQRRIVRYISQMFPIPRPFIRCQLRLQSTEIVPTTVRLPVSTIPLDNTNDAGVQELHILTLPRD